MSLLDELRELAAELTPSQFPIQNELPQVLGALIYYVDTRLNAASPPENTSRARKLPPAEPFR